MKVFNLRNDLINDYSEYIKSFINIKDNRIHQIVFNAIENGALWPDPLIQLNPAFESNKTIDDLVAENLLHKECSKIFRNEKKDDNPIGRQLKLHKHQVEAIESARAGHNYVLTTGTGSGKSLAYMIPIVDHVLKNGSGKGIKAIIVYPMNALANSQEGELNKFLCIGYPDKKSPVTFAKYTGQENDEIRRVIISDPPDILLTNYVMLELILTRPKDAELVDRAKGVRFLVFDELHSYRGRQGADVALLIRRLKESIANHSIQCIGTSATLAGKGTFEGQKAEVAEVASKIFGSTFLPENIIMETLVRKSKNFDENDLTFVQMLRDRILNKEKKPARTFNDYLDDPLSRWIEIAFGVVKDNKSNLFKRVQPQTITGKKGAAEKLSTLTGITIEICEQTIEEHLLSSYECEPDSEAGFPPFAFRLHQFISRGNKVYATLESEESRHISMSGQQFVAGDRSKTFFPLVFCRECGQEYFCVNLKSSRNEDNETIESRELSDRIRDEENDPGFLYSNSSRPWPESEEDMIERLPDEWLEDTGDTQRVRRSMRKNLPRTIKILEDGIVSSSGNSFAFVPAHFRFCLYCGVSYSSYQRIDYTKLTSLSTEGRSNATTVLCLSLIRRLRKEESLAAQSRKLLSFTDNRQDASLQAGHFNDFTETGVLRGAIYKAVERAGRQGVRSEDIVHEVFKSLDLPFDAYASDPTVRFAAREEKNRALRDVIGYRIYRDLKHGWRIVSPNLEQCGLLQIDYPFLDEVCAAEDIWGNAKLHPALTSASKETRMKITKTLLDHIRRTLCIKVEYLDPEYQERIYSLSFQHLRDPWALDENEQKQMEHASTLFSCSKDANSYSDYNVYLSARGTFGQYLRRRATFPEYTEILKVTETAIICENLLKCLQKGGLIEVTEQNEPAPGYQIPASAMLWKVGDGTIPFHDPLRVPNLPEEGAKTNKYFIQFYRSILPDGIGIESKEHTAQVKSNTRQEREAKFGTAELPILFCSPTMELGVDIKELNAVNMRNVPPTPANYSQRSGRAGRSGQPALVFTYCSTYSSHDQHFFRRPQNMVGGSVAAPRMDLANEDLFRSHIHAIWLQVSGLSLGMTLTAILNIDGDNPSFEFLPNVKDKLESKSCKTMTFDRAKEIFNTIGEYVSNAPWYSERWLQEAVDQIPLRLKKACERWIDLYRSALAQRDLQHRMINDRTKNMDERNRAKIRRAQAEAQIHILTESNNIYENDFYSYRYFASEGFLPGYNFPRLPLSAFIPARRISGKADDYLTRPRFLAISEFGPRAVVYHEGSRYRINQVILPPDSRNAQGEVNTTHAKRCEKCGYIHPVFDGDGPDRCELCNASLNFKMDNLFRIQNVSTKREARINSDEEERLRMGFELVTGFRFERHAEGESCRSGIIKHGEEAMASIDYSDSASIWRMNFGWVRRADKDRHGFVLDTNNGYWEKNDMDLENDGDDPMSAQTRRIIPFVEDHKNCLVYIPSKTLDDNLFVSLAAALKRAIQVKYQLEESELAVELLPSRYDMRQVLFYESSEGGAGVLKRLLDDRDAIPELAITALEICHFSPETGEDRRRAYGSDEDCEAACYDCLLSYTNQPDHARLDRQTIKDYLQMLAASSVESSPSAQSRTEKYERLIRLCQSELEKSWIEFLQASNLLLPSSAQQLIEQCGTRPDFLYDAGSCAVYIDGPAHEYPERARRDREQDECMENLGYTIIRFTLKDDWKEIVKKYPNVFGRFQ